MTLCEPLLSREQRGRPSSSCIAAAVGEEAEAVAEIEAGRLRQREEAEWATEERTPEKTVVPAEQ